MFVKTAKVGKRLLVLGISGVGALAGGSTTVVAKYTSMGAVGKAALLLGKAPVTVASAPVLGAAAAGLLVVGVAAWGVTKLSETLSGAQERARVEGFQDGPGGT